MANKMKPVALGYAALKNGSKPPLPCPLCGGEMKYDSFAGKHFCYSSDDGKCPRIEKLGLIYGGDHIQGETLAWNGDAELYAVRGYGGKTNVCVENADKANGRWKWEFENIRPAT